MDSKTDADRHQIGYVIAGIAGGLVAVGIAALVTLALKDPKTKASLKTIKTNAKHLATKFLSEEKVTEAKPKGKK